MTQRITIDQLQLDLRGLDPALAQAAVAQLGPALRRALGQTLSLSGDVSTTAAGRASGPIDAGAVPAAADAAAMAQGLAASLARGISGGRG